MKIGMPLVAQAAPATGGGTSMRPVARLTNLTVGCAWAQALLAPTLSEAEARRLGANIAGVLGQDFLSRFSFTLDYRANLLLPELGDGERDEAPVRDQRRVRLPLRESDGRFVIDLPGTRFVPASAVDGMVLVGGAGTNQLLAKTAAQSGELLPLDDGRAARLVTLRRCRLVRWRCGMCRGGHVGHGWC